MFPVYYEQTTSNHRIYITKNQNKPVLTTSSQTILQIRINRLKQQISSENNPILSMVLFVRHCKELCKEPVSSLPLLLSFLLESNSLNNVSRMMRLSSAGLETTGNI